MCFGGFVVGWATMVSPLSSSGTLFILLLSVHHISMRTREGFQAPELVRVVSF